MRMALAGALRCTPKKSTNSRGESTDAGQWRPAPPSTARRVIGAEVVPRSASQTCAIQHLATTSVFRDEVMKIIHKLIASYVQLLGKSRRFRSQHLGIYGNSSFSRDLCRTYGTWQQQHWQRHRQRQPSDSSIQMHVPHVRRLCQHRKARITQILAKSHNAACYWRGGCTLSCF